MAEKHVHVAVAVIIREGRVLIARRPDHVHQGGLLEFPGGKVEAGETVRDALVREILEETGLQVPPASLRPLIGIRHDYGDKRVFLDVWRTDEAAGTAQGLEGQPVQWLPIEDLDDEAFPVANRAIIRALRLPVWLAITGAFQTPADLVNQFRERVQLARPPLVVLRAPGLTAWEYQAVGRDLIAIGREYGVSLLVHGSAAQLELLPDAAGLHMPWREAMACKTRPVMADKWLGVSCHNEREIAHGAGLGADYLTLGPVAPTPSHPGAPSLGWETFEQQVRGANIPVFALGGLAPDDRDSAIAAGAQGVAGISLWWPGI